MLLDNKKHLKAKQYQCITVDEETHLFQPVGTEVEDVVIDPVELVVDYAALISEYAKCPHLREWQGPLPYKGESKKEQNRRYILNTHIYKEQLKMKDALLAFINKYGLFGLLNDNAMAFDYEGQMVLSNGLLANFESDYPEKVVIGQYDKDSPFVVRSFKVYAYEEYIKQYFPNVPAAEAVKLKDEAKTRHYAECMEDILQNRRILACTDYVAGIDKQSRSPLIIQGMNAVLSFKKDVPVYDIKQRSLIEYCHSMFFLNEISGENRSVRICQYKRCHKPFTDRNSKYCCPECMVKANKRSTKKGDKDNG